MQTWLKTIASKFINKLPGDTIGDFVIALRHLVFALNWCKYYWTCT